MTTSDTVVQEGIFVGANKQSLVSDYHFEDEVVAFGAGTMIAMWKPLTENRRGVYDTYKKHTGEVTVVRFVQKTPYLISAAEDGIINLWRKQGTRYEHMRSLEFHQLSVTCLSVISADIFVSGSADGCIAVWKKDEEKEDWAVIHEFTVKNNFYPLTLALQDIGDEGEYVLAIGGTDVKVYLYSFILASDSMLVLNFTPCASLSGHEDWIKCLSWVQEQSQDSYLLASGSQDRYVRLWRLKLNDTDPDDRDSLKLVLLSNKKYRISIGDRDNASICFDALIMGHDDWVSDLRWHPSYYYGSDKVLRLLTSTADTALMIWEMDEESGIWCCVSRLGELSIKGALTATGASGGFWSCLWFRGPNGEEYIIANGKTGSFRMYSSSDSEKKTWVPSLGITGPMRESTDIVWSPGGDYVMSTSLDQTTRLFAPWRVNKEVTWHEFARPQIHGYDMICLDNINLTKFVSGGDEKILRVFEMTNSIRGHLAKFADIKVDTFDEALPDSAALPVLGLSNKAANDQLEAGQAHEDSPNDDGNDPINDVLEELNTPPLEDYLQRYTLFPEVEKLYGHGYEITCCATSPDGKLIASACRSNNARHSVIRLFNVENDYLQCKDTLKGHNLSITSLEFSADGKHLMAVSRDRLFSLWKRVGDTEFELVRLQEKAHSRIVWDCSWAPTTQYGSFVFTCARDKQVKLWEIKENEVSIVASIKLRSAVTSIDCLKYIVSHGRVHLVAGFDDGLISFLTTDLSKHEKEILVDFEFDTAITPADKITKVKFSPKLISGRIHLACTSVDHSVRLYSICYQEL